MAAAMVTAVAGPHGALAAIIAFGLVARLVIAITMTPWQSPDEPKHFEYVRILADQRAKLWAERRLPNMDDADPRLQAEIIVSVARYGYFSAIRQPTPRPLPVRFEDVWPDGTHTQLHRPSLYYYLAAPVLLPFTQASLETQVFVVRLVSVALSTATIWVVAQVARTLAPSDPFVPLVAGAFVAALPMHAYIGGAVNNDNLATLVGSAILLVLLRGVRDGFRPTTWALVLVFVVLGLATKRVIVGLGPAVALAGCFSLGSLRGRRLVAALGAVCLGCLFLLNALGPRIGLGWLPLDALLTALSAYALNFPDHLKRFFAVPIDSPEVWALVTRHQKLFLMSFWGIFGWFSQGMPPDLYDALMLVTGIGAAGFLGWLLWQAVVAWTPGGEAARRALRMGLVCATAVITMIALAEGERLAYLSPNYIPQGRYLFAVVAAIASMFALGCRLLLPARVCGTRLPVAALVLALVALDVYVYATVLLPFFHATAAQV